MGLLGKMFPWLVMAFGSFLGLLHWPVKLNSCVATSKNITLMSYKNSGKLLCLSFWALLYLTRFPTWGGLLSSMIYWQVYLAFGNNENFPCPWNYSPLLPSGKHMWQWTMYSPHIVDFIKTSTDKGVCNCHFWLPKGIPRIIVQWFVMRLSSSP